DSAARGGPGARVPRAGRNRHVVRDDSGLPGVLRLSARDGGNPAGRRAPAVLTRSAALPAAQVQPKAPLRRRGWNSAATGGGPAAGPSGAARLHPATATPPARAARPGATATAGSPR